MKFFEFSKISEYIKQNRMMVISAVIIFFGMLFISSPVQKSPEERRFQFSKRMEEAELARKVAVAINRGESLLNNGMKAFEQGEYNDRPFQMALAQFQFAMGLKNDTALKSKADLCLSKMREIGNKKDAETRALQTRINQNLHELENTKETYEKKNPEDFDYPDRIVIQKALEKANDILDHVPTHRDAMNYRAFFVQMGTILDQNLPDEAVEAEMNAKLFDMAMSLLVNGEHYNALLNFQEISNSGLKNSKIIEIAEDLAIKTIYHLEEVVKPQFARAMNLKNSGRNREAAVIVNEILKIYPTYKDQELQETLQGLSEDLANRLKPDAEKEFARAQSLQSKGRISKAIQSFKEVLKRMPLENNEYHVWAKEEIAELE